MHHVHEIAQLKFLNTAKLRIPILRDALGIGIVKFLAIPASLGVAVILARALGPSDYGTYAFVLSIINILALLLTGGLAQLVTREVAFALANNQKNFIKGIINVSIIWALCSSIFLIVGMWGVLTFFDITIDSNTRIVLLTGLPAIFILCLSPAWAGTLRGYGLGAKSQFPGLLLLPLMQLTTIVILLVLDRLDVQTAMMTFVLSSLLVAIVGFTLMRKTTSKILQSTMASYKLGPWAKSTAIFTGIALITYLNTQVGVLLLGFTSTKADVGAFQIADRGAQLVILAAAITELVLAPHIARYYQVKKVDRLKSLFTTSQRIVALITFIVALPMIFIGEPIVRLLFGEGYVDLSVQPLAIISIAFVIRGLFGPTATFLSMTGKENTVFVVQIIGLLVTMVLTLILAPKLGATGASYASATGILTCAGLLAIEIHRKLGISIKMILFV